MDKEEEKPIRVKLSEEKKQQVEKRAASLGLKLGQYIRMLIDKDLNDTK
jgi:predicted DNA binding CopG/RHH family protein